MKLDGKKILILLAILALVASTAVYTVNQRYIAMEKFLGKITVDSEGKPIINRPGLHFKVPMLTQIIQLDTRMQTLDSKPERIPTKDQKFVYVDYFVKWRIKDFYSFYVSTGNYFDRVNSLLKPKVSDSLKAEFGSKSIEEVVTEDREDIMKKVKQDLVGKTGSLGLEIIDMRIKRIDLPEEVAQSVYARMRAKRQQEANKHRFEGQKEAEIIRAEADFEAKKILAEANKKSEILRGEADAKAARIYSDAFNKNPEFYQFYRSLNAYSNVFNNKDNVLVLSPDSDFFSYFNRKNIGK